MKILVLGGTGMAGHTIALYLYENAHDVTVFSRKPFTYVKNIIGDATDFELLASIISTGEFDVVINCIGSLNQFAENDKCNAVLLNSYLPHYLCQITKNIHTKIIHMSTDCVFSGESGQYSEGDLRDGRSFYDRSKSLGEIDDEKNLTFRNSIIGPDMHEHGIGLFNWFMAQNNKINGYTKAIWSGVTTLTLARAMEKAMEENLVGVYHLTNNESICKYDLVKLFNKYFKGNKLDIFSVDGISLDKSLVNNRKDFSFVVPSYEQMVADMYRWIKEHESLYPHYKFGG